MRNAIILSVLAAALAVAAVLTFGWGGALADGRVWFGPVLGLVFAAGAFAMARMVPQARAEERARAMSGWVPVGEETRQVSPQVHRLASAINEQLADSPYRVLTAPGGVRVEWNTGDIRYRSLVLPHRVQTVFSTTLMEVAADTFQRADVLQHYDSSLGRITGDVQGGRVVSLERRIDLAVGAQGVTKPVDYFLNTTNVSNAVKAAMSSNGFKGTWDIQTKGGLLGAGIGVATMLVIGAMTLTS